MDSIQEWTNGQVEAPPPPVMDWVAVKPCGCLVAAHVDGPVSDPEIGNLLAEWREGGRGAERRPAGSYVVAKCVHYTPATEPARPRNAYGSWSRSK